MHKRVGTGVAVALAAVILSCSSRLVAPSSKPVRGTAASATVAAYTPPSAVTSAGVTATVQGELPAPVIGPVRPALPYAQLTAAVIRSRTSKRLTQNALNKNTLCAPGFIADRNRSGHPQHENELFHLYVLGGQREYETGAVMPSGSIIVKRSFIGADLPPAQSGTTAYFLMFKVLGQNPAGGDWLYATTKPNGEVIRSGALADCAGCHIRQAQSDYVFRKYD
jgi:Cytochrome P460